MALRRPPTTFSDEINAADLAANSVGASELADNAVDSDAIAANAVVTAKIADSTGASDGITTAKLATNAVTTAKITDANITTAKVADNAVTSAKVADAVFTDNIEINPHIKPGMLYPAMKDTGGTVRQVDGTTAVVASTVGPAGSTITSSLYGTVQSDGRMYYYTDIKGSEPIEDPRIGAHFGSQRYQFKSLQQLDNETAHEGFKVFSIDGRRWCRARGKNHAIHYGTYGEIIQLNPVSTDDWYEVTGYFNAVNLGTLLLSNSATNVNIYIDGTDTGQDFNTRTTANGPLIADFMRASQSWTNQNIGSVSLGIHTIKIGATSTYWFFSGIELIAQDTASATTRNQIQIQPQNVVSYGKKYSVGIAQSTTDKKALHYNPFAFKTDGTTAWASGAHNGTSLPVGTGSSHNIDTATSLGLANWVHSSNYYKPYNGGRVVIWVDSAGTVKTSVTVMPPNARCRANSGTIANATAKANASIANNTFYPTMEAGVPTDYETTSLSEVSKRYLFREFGNGWANDNNARRDLSLVTAQGQDMQWFMEDGLTGFQCQNGTVAGVSTGIYPVSTNNQFNLSWIGTGISIVNNDNVGNTSSNSMAQYTIAQNLPYGTHCLKFARAGTVTSSPMHIDGINVGTGWFRFEELIYHQPKRPPIPEDAVVLSDYMLMADYVPCTTGHDNAGPGPISKGIRFQSASHDIWNDAGAGITYNQSYMNSIYGVSLYTNNGTSEGRCVGFGSGFGCHYLRDTNRNNDMMVRLDGANYTETGSNEWDSGTEWDAHSDGAISKHGANGFFAYGIKDQTLGLHTFGDKKLSGSNYNAWSAFEIASPIHTSSHYHEFESPHLKCPVGGDRNMEQHNLVVTADGKTWDQLTRDTSYIGNMVFNANTDTSYNSGAVIILDEWRGSPQITGRLYFNKDWAIAYDRFVCLVDGQYEIIIQGINDGGSATDGMQINLNGVVLVKGHFGNGSHTNIHSSVVVTCKRLDYIQFQGQVHENDMYAGYHIKRLS